MNIEASDGFATGSFGARFRRLRLALGGKQITMCASGLRCTDAAISNWERGKRLPTRRMMTKVLDTFVRLGASPLDIDGLSSAWLAERSARAPAASIYRQHDVEACRTA